MISTIILIPVYRRPEILEITVNDLQKHKQYSVLPVFIVSPEDPDIARIEHLLRNEVKYYYYNDNLGEKMNFGIQMILQNFQFGYLMNFGSDDIMSIDIWNHYRPFIGNVDIFGIDSVKVIDYYTDDEYILANSNTTKAIGAGRMIRREVLSSMIKKGHRIYTPSLNAGLDTDSSNNIKKHLGVEELIIKQPQGVYYITDIKSNTNINHIFFLKKHLKPIEK
jgi:hypothetical protein